MRVGFKPGKRQNTMVLSLIVAAIAAAGLSLYPLGRLISGKMAEIRDGLIARLETVLGCELSYDNLSPSFIRSLTISGLTLRARSTNALMLDADRVEVYLGVLFPAHGFPRIGVREIDIEGASADYSAAKSSGFITTISELLTENGSEAGGPIRVNVRGSRVDVREAGLKAELTGLLAEGSFDETGIELRASCDGRLSMRGMEDVSGGITVSGRAAADFRTARIIVETSVDSADFSMTPQTFSLSKRGSLISVRKVEDAAPIDASGEIDFESGKYTVECAFESLRPAAFGSFKGRLSGFSKWLSAVGTGGASLSGSLKDGTIEYAVKGVFLAPKSLLPEGSSIVLDANGDGKSLAIRTARLQGPDGAIEFSGMLALPGMTPDGIASLDWNIKGEPLKGRFEIRTADGSISANSESLQFADAEFIGIRAALRPGALASELSLTASLRKLAFDSPENQPADSEPKVPVSASLITLSGSLMTGKKPSIDAELALDSLEVGPLYSILSGFLGLPGSAPAELASHFRLSSDIYFNTDFSSFSYSAPKLLISYPEKPDNRGEFSFSGSRTSLALNRFSILWDGIEAAGDVKVDFSSREMASFASSLNVQGIPYTLSGEIYGTQQLYVRGSHGLEIHLTRASGEALFSLGMQDFPLPLKGIETALSLDASGRFKNMGEFTVVLDSGRLEQTKGILPSWAAVTFSGALDAAGAHFERIGFEDQYSRLEGGADVRYALGSDRFLELSAELASGTGEYYGADGRISNGEADISVKLREAPLARLGSTILTGAVNADISLKGSPSASTASFKGGLSNATFLGMPLAAETAGETKGGIWTFHGLDASFFVFDLIDGEASYIAAADDFNLDSGFRMRIGREPLSSLLKADGKLFSNGELLPEFSGALGDLSFGPVKAASWPIAARLIHGGGMEFKGGAKEECSINFQPSGNFAIETRSPLALRAKAEGSLKNGKLSAEIPDFTLDFARIWSLIGVPAVDFKAGVLRGSLSISGSSRDPVFNGKARAEGMICSIPDFMPGSFGPFSTDVTAVANEIRIPETRVQAGSASVKASAGIDIESWLPARVDLHAATIADSLVDSKTMISGIDIEGKSRFDLSFLFARDFFSIKGFVVLDEGSILLAPAQEGGQASGGPSEYPMMVALSLGFGKKVEFLWPNRKFPLLRANFDPNSSGIAVAFDGMKESFSVKGAAKMRGGEVLYFRRNFYLKEGKLVFNESQDFFDPLLSFRAEMREQDDSGPVTIILRMDDTRLSQFKPTLESIPAYPESTLLAMLGEEVLGVHTDDLKTLTSSQILTRTMTSAGAAAGDILAQTSLVRKTEGWMRDMLSLDMFSIRSPIVQNILIGAVNPVDIDRTSTLGDYLDGTTVSGGKYVGSDLFLQGLAQARRDEGSNFGNLSVALEFLLELNTPFFRLLYSFAPEWEHRDSLFIGDQSIGVYFSIPY
jgi:translocation and assembly module TamB